jgi:hypothetical protein
MGDRPSGKVKFYIITDIERRLLVFDALWGHVTTKFQTWLDTGLMIIPEGLTSSLHVLDMVVNKPFKDFCVSSVEEGCYMETAW